MINRIRTWFHGKTRITMCFDHATVGSLVMTHITIQGTPDHVGKVISILSEIDRESERR